MKLVILGGPGAGKGTQAALLHHALGIVGISTGDILRTAIAAQTELGKQVQAQVEHGELVSDNSMIDLIRERLLQPDVAQGWLLDGYPRTAFQAEELDFLLDSLKQHLDFAILLAVPDAVLINRSLTRARTDDTLDVIQRRLALFHERTTPLLEYYAMRDRLLTVDGNQAMDQVTQTIVQYAKQKQG